VTVVCDNGAQIVSEVNQLDGGVVICGYRFRDMHFSEIQDYLPSGFQMLLLASPSKLQDSDIGDIVSLPMPIKVQDLLNTLEMMMTRYIRWKKKQKKKPRVRSESEKRTLRETKELLMERNHMTEDEAHRYIQKLSMDSGTNMIETALMILDLNGKEWDI
jgi:response regulator NasT